MGNYGDHSHDHDHGPDGYWGGREDEQREYELGREICRQNHADKRPDRLAALEPDRDFQAEEARRKLRRQEEQVEAEAKVAEMTPEEILRDLVRRFDSDADCHRGSEDIRSSVRRSYYNALRKRFLGAPASEPPREFRTGL